MMDQPSYLHFDSSKYTWHPETNYRMHPEQYRVGKGEQGVLICEPYKSEIGPYWRFKTETIAKESSEKIYELFLAYLAEDDFIGADMARKYLQMGFTRARRYANYKGGKNMIRIMTTGSWRKVPERTKKPELPPFFSIAGKLPKPMSITPV